MLVYLDSEKSSVYQIRNPSRSFLCGPSMSGKTTLLMKTFVITNVRGKSHMI